MSRTAAFSFSVAAGGDRVESPPACPACPALTMPRLLRIANYFNSEYCDARIDASDLRGGPEAKARVLWHATAGGVLVAQGLPPAPEGKAYELWASAGQGAPVPAGVFAVDAKGVGSLRVAPLLSSEALDTFAVTLEPAAGVPAPTGRMYLVGKL